VHKRSLYLALTSGGTMRCRVAVGGCAMPADHGLLHGPSPLPSLNSSRQHMGRAVELFSVESRLAGLKVEGKHHEDAERRGDAKPKEEIHV
jgi:hypothetical protein